MKTEKISSLSNGLKVVSMQMPERQKAALIAGIKVGPVNETKQNNGASHFTEHMLFKTNKYRNSSQIARDLEWKGISVNAFTGKNSTAFYAKAPSHTLEDAIQVAFEAYTNHNYVKKEMDIERGVILGEMRMYREQPLMHILYNLLTPYFFKGTSLEKSELGPEEVISNITKKDMIAFKKRYYVPENTIISVAGNFDEREVLGQLERTFGALPKTDFTKDRVRLKVRVKEREPLYEEREGVDQIYLAQAFKTADQFSKDDYFASQLLSTAIGGGMSSRMFRELRDKRGVGYMTLSMCWGHPAGIMVYFVNGSLKKQDEIRKVLDEITTDIVKNGLPKKELEGVKNKQISDCQDSLEHVESIAMSLFGKTAFNYPVSILDRINGIKSITNDNIVEVANKYLTNPRVEVGIKPK